MSARPLSVTAYVQVSFPEVCCLDPKRSVLLGFEACRARGLGSVLEPLGLEYEDDTCVCACVCWVHAFPFSKQETSQNDL